jgi:hypothetical protein
VSYRVAITVTHDARRDEENLRAEVPDLGAAIAMLQRAQSMLVNPVTVTIRRADVREQLRMNRGRGTGREARR